MQNPEPSERSDGFRLGAAGSFVWFHTFDWRAGHSRRGPIFGGNNACR